MSNKENILKPCWTHFTATLAYERFLLKNEFHRLMETHKKRTENVIAPIVLKTFVLFSIFARLLLRHKLGR